MLFIQMGQAGLIKILFDFKKNFSLIKKKSSLKAFEWEDWVVIGLYFVVVLGVGLGVTFIGRKKNQNTTDFLLAGRALGFLPVNIITLIIRYSKIFRLLALFSHRILELVILWAHLVQRRPRG